MSLLKVRAIDAGVVLLIATASAAAQTASTSRTPSPAGVHVPESPAIFHDAVSPEQLRELEQWTRDYGEWRAWFLRWHNRRQPGVLSVRAREPRPTPPGWLPGLCSSLIDDTGALADGCRAWREWRQDYATVLMAGEIAQQRANLEIPQKSVWWQHVHLDALWPMTQSGSRVFGVFGTHATFPVSKRAQVFISPGVILMRLPTRDGKGTWSVATDWGFSYRMTDFTMPLMRRPSTLHLNVARVWVLGTGDAPIRHELYLAGLSLTLKSRVKPAGLP